VLIPSAAEREPRSQHLPAKRENETELKSLQALMVAARIAIRSSSGCTYLANLGAAAAHVNGEVRFFIFFM
jgi:hypothetical protein